MFQRRLNFNINFEFNIKSNLNIKISFDRGLQKSPTSTPFPKAKNGIFKTKYYEGF